MTIVQPTVAVSSQARVAVQDFVRQWAIVNGCEEHGLLRGLLTERRVVP